MNLRFQCWWMVYTCVYTVYTQKAKGNFQTFGLFSKILLIKSDYFCVCSRNVFLISHLIWVSVCICTGMLGCAVLYMLCVNKCQHRTLLIRMTMIVCTTNEKRESKMKNCCEKKWWKNLPKIKKLFFQQQKKKWKKSYAVCIKWLRHKRLVHSRILKFICVYDYLW